MSWLGPGPVNQPPELPKHLRNFNWGAFLFTWLWALFHRSYVIALLCWIAGLGIVTMILMGIYGNELAWRNRLFESMEHCLRVQRAWTVAACICLALGPMMVVLSIILRR